MGMDIPQPNPDRDELSPSGEEWVEVTEAEGGHAQILTLWRLEDTSEGPQARTVWRAIRPRGGHGPLLLVA